MFHDFLPAYFEWWHIPFISLAVFIGESYGSLVGAGSVVTIPAFLTAGVPLQSAIAIDAAGALGTETGILTETRRKVLENKKLVILLIIPITLGGVVGTWLLLNVSTTIIKYTMVAAVIYVLFHAYFGKKPNPRSISKSSYALLAAFLFFIGLYTNFIGAGEGTFGKIALMSILGMTFIQSQGIKSTATMPTRVYSLVVTGIAGLIIWPYLLTFWISGFFAGKYATRFVKRVPDKHMKAIMTIVSLGFIFYLLFFY